MTMEEIRNNPINLKRKLTAILCADVKGYARLMTTDEKATIRTLQSYRRIIGAIIEKHRGRIVDSPGDYVLAEIPSVIDAVQCAMEIQHDLSLANAKLPEDRRMTFRIGINLGDIIEDEERLYGNGLNIADRMQGLAEGGGVCISGSVYDQVKNKLPLGYHYLGAISVKNIAEPIRVYAVVTDVNGGKSDRYESIWHNRRRLFGALAVLVVVLMAALAIRGWHSEDSLQIMNNVIHSTGEAERVDSFSIAVLPFANMCKEDKYEIICDGITNGITTSLSKLPHLFVIASDSAMAYKGRSRFPQQIGRELSVRYLLTGCIQKDRQTLRISACLIDVERGNQIWAEHYDRDMADIFALQDDITLRVLTALQVNLTEGEQARIHGRGTNSLGAYIKGCQGRKYLLQLNRGGNSRAKVLAQDAMVLDPNYHMAYWILAATHVIDVWLGDTPDPATSLQQAETLIRKVLALDETLSDAHGLLSHIYTLKRDHDKALIEAERAVALNPNSADALMFHGIALHYAGRHREAVMSFKRAMRLNPFPQALYYLGLAAAWRDAGRYEEAIAAVLKALSRNADTVYVYTCLASTYSLMGRHDEGCTAAQKITSIDPGFSLRYFGRILPYRDKSEVDRVVNALHNVGVR